MQRLFDNHQRQQKNSECRVLRAWKQNPLDQGRPNSVLEGRCPAEFNSNLPQHTCTEASSMPGKTLISCFMCV